MSEDENTQDETSESPPSEEPETPPVFLIERAKEDFARKDRGALEEPAEEEAGEE